MRAWIRTAEAFRLQAMRRLLRALGDRSELISKLMKLHLHRISCHHANNETREDKRSQLCFGRSVPTRQRDSGTCFDFLGRREHRFGKKMLKVLKPDMGMARPRPIYFRVETGKENL